MHKPILPYSLLLILLIFFLLTTKVKSLQRGRMVGARQDIDNVKTNKEVQDLGKFSIEEYNKEIRDNIQPSSPIRSIGLDGGSKLTFVEVIKAQRQVVAGLKYYLTVKAQEGDHTRVFDAVVVVKPWVQSKKLLNFGPSLGSNLIQVSSESRVV